MVVTKGKKCSSLYLMQKKIVDSEINVVDDEGILELCHNILSNMSEKGLMMAVKKNLLSGWKNGSLNMCTHSLVEKQT